MKTTIANNLIGLQQARPPGRLEQKLLGDIFSWELPGSELDRLLDEELSKLKITLTPSRRRPFWKRTFLYFALAGLKAGYFYARVVQLRKERGFRLKEATFRKKEAEYKHLMAETKNAILRLQMNPHFIFNCMNSINSCIVHKEVEKASTYLHQFATLMRMILRFADKPLIALSDEIELLEHYLQAEKMRFDKSFDYRIDLQGNIDPDELLIPTMILQPLVENAIWHGLSNKKKGKGTIEIAMWQEEKSLYCSVEDNGIGRAASSLLGRNHKAYGSKALSITKNRLQLLDSIDGVAASLVFHDLVNDTNRPAGTKVILQFPLF